MASTTSTSPQETKKNGSATLASWTYDTARVGFLDEAVAYQDNYTITVDNTSYDDRGQLLSTVTTINDGTDPADSYTVDRTYFESGNTKTLKYPGSSSREEVTYTYDPRTNQPETLTSGASTKIVSAASWTIHGQPDAQTWDSGTYAMAIDWIYDTDTLRLAELRAGIDGTMNVQRLKYTYDENSNIETIRDYRNSSQYQCFEYDNLNRLKEAETSDDCTSPTSSPGDGDFDHSYTYDNLGNIKPTGAGYTYGTGTAGPHAPAAANGWTYTYDNNGNQNTRTHPSPSSEVDTLTFDVNNRLVNYESDTNGTPTDTEFIYDADGNRVAVIDNAGVATHYIAGIYQITGSAEENTYTFGGQTVGINKGGTRHHVVTDHLGSVTATIEYGLAATETNIERLRYEPYGNKRTTEATAGDRTYTGQIDDTAMTGLMYYNARYYDPTLRTFISADTIVPDPSSALGWNRYSYVNNSPTGSNDPTGHCTLSSGVAVDGDDEEPCTSPLFKQALQIGRDKGLSDDLIVLAYDTAVGLEPFWHNGCPMAEMDFGSGCTLPRDDGWWSLGDLDPAEWSRCRSHFGQCSDYVNISLIAKSRTSSDKGAARNALRHSIWSALLNLDLGEFDAFQWMLAHEAFSPTNPPGPEERADSQSDWANNYYGNQIAAAVDAASLNVTTETNVVEVTARIALEAGQLCLATGSTLVNPERCGR